VKFLARKKGKKTNFFAASLFVFVGSDIRGPVLKKIVSGINIPNPQHYYQAAEYSHAKKLS
jgi:hypothetical protein